MIGEWVQQGARAMGISLPEGAGERFEAYHHLLQEANRRMNLTRVLDDEREAVDRHYLDSLTPLTTAFMSGARTLCDVGSGAGFPGIPLAIARPDIRVTMVDSLGKRVKFLQDVIAQLGLNAEALHLRAEEAARDGMLRDRFDVATARAVAPLNELVELTMPFVKVGGVLIAYKGPSLDEELPDAGKAIRALRGRVRDMAKVAIPGRDWDHRLLAVDKLAPTSGAYPRRPGEAHRNPISGG